jgi:hypothetical protein
VSIMTMTPTVTMPSVVKEVAKKRAHNAVIAKDFAGALSPVLAQARYLYPNTPMTVEPIGMVHAWVAQKTLKRDILRVFTVSDLLNI